MTVLDVDGNPVEVGVRYELNRNFCSARAGTIFIPRRIKDGRVICEWEEPIYNISHNCHGFFKHEIGYFIETGMLRRVEDPDDGVYEGDHWI